MMLLSPSQIARRLRALGDKIDKTIEQDFNKRFKAELGRYSLVSLTYEQFRRVCTKSLNYVHSRISTGWDQAYLLISGG